MALELDYIPMPTNVVGAGPIAPRRARSRLERQSIW